VGKRKTSIEIMKTMAEITGSFYFGLQTLTPEVLKNCHRENIPEESLKKLLRLSKSKGIPIEVDLIFGLPGETIWTFFETLHRLAAMGIQSPLVYQLRLLPGTELSEKQRYEYGYNTHFRPLNNRFGEYKFGDRTKRIIEVEEIATSNKDFSFDDYMLVREAGFFACLMLEYGAFKHTIAALSKRGTNFYSVHALISGCRSQRFKKFMADYKDCCRMELSDSSDLSDKWDDLKVGKYFKINLGFTGYCLLGNQGVLDDIEKQFDHWVWIEKELGHRPKLKEALAKDKAERLNPKKNKELAAVMDKYKYLSGYDYYEKVLMNAPRVLFQK